METLVFQLCGASALSPRKLMTQFEEAVGLEFNKIIREKTAHPASGERQVSLTKKLRSDIANESGGYEVYMFSNMPKDAKYIVTDWDSFLDVHFPYQAISAGVVLTRNVESRIIDFCRDQEFEYGYIAQLSKEKCYPSLYLYGINGGGGRESLLASGPALERKQAIGKWMASEKTYVEGLIRTVYRWNFFSKTMLNSTVDGKTLEAEIKVSAVGELSQIRDDLFLWEIQSEEDVEIARDALQTRIVAA